MFSERMSKLQNTCIVSIYRHTCFHGTVFKVTMWVPAPLLNYEPPKGRESQLLHNPAWGRWCPRTGHNLGFLGSDSWQCYLPVPGPSGFRWRWMPFSERRTTWSNLMGGREGSRANSKRSRQRAATTFISFMANCCPMQFLQWPAQGGMRLWGVRRDGIQCSQ